MWEQRGLLSVFTCDIHTDERACVGRVKCERKVTAFV
jgi:hypothetical protein